MTDIKFALRPKQKLFVENTARFSFYVGGLGAGKTYAGAIRSILTALKHPGSLGLIGAPTFPMLRDTTQRTFFDLFPEQLIKTYNKNDAHLYIVNGSEILFRSMDQPDRARGLNLCWFWMDEAPFCGYYAWTVLKARAGRQDPSRFPTLGWATGTPKGKDGFYRDFEEHPKKNHFLVRASTYENAVNLPEGYVEGLGYEGAFKLQEVEGQFTAFEGLVYQFQAETGTPDSHIMPPGLAFKLPSGNFLVDTPHGYVKVAREHDVPEGQTIITVTRMLGGVDWGFTNPAVGLVIAIENERRAYLLEEFYQRRAPRPTVVIPALVAQAKLFELTSIYCDPAEPQSIDELKNALAKEDLLINVKAGDNSIVSGIHTIRTFLSKGDDGLPDLRVHPRCKNTVNEFGVYQYPTKEEKERNPTELPVPQNDHCLVAGTCITTMRGAKPIERVRVGDYVLNRAGWCEVLASGKTFASATVVQANFTNGAKLIGTPDHRVWVERVGWVELGHLEAGMVVLEIPTKRTRNHVEVVSVTPLKKQYAVYDLSVKTKPEFFANGILVHNSMGALRYSLHTTFGLGRNGEIGVAASHANTGSDGIVDEAEKALLREMSDDTIAIVRGQAAANILRDLDKKGLVFDNFYRFDPMSGYK